MRDLCVVCGNDIPEGFMVCWACMREHGLEMPRFVYSEDGLDVDYRGTEEVERECRGDWGQDV